MLTLDMLRQNSALAGLTDAQFSAIAEMSKNDEATVIGNRIGALHGQYDADILSITGIKKNDGEKSYDYNKRVLGKYKADIESFKTTKADLDAANAKITELEGKIAAGASDATLTQQLSDQKKRVSDLQKALADKDKAIAAAATEAAKALKEAYIDFGFQQAVADIKFKAGIPESVQSVLLNSAKAEILQKGTPDLIEENGVKKIVFRDANNNVISNPKNNLNPYTIKDFLGETSLKDVIDFGRKQPGGGTGPIVNPQPGSTTLDFSGVKTQLEADKLIENYLLQNGLTRDSSEFAEQSLQLRTENKIAELPMR